MHIQSKLPTVGTTIFTVMSQLAVEHNAINLGQGFPNFDCHPKLKELVNHHLQNGKNQYVHMAGLPKLRERISEKINHSYGKAVDSNLEITVTAGATQALFTAIAAFVSPGDEVIIFDPAYDSYRPSVEVMGAKAVAYALTGPDFKINWDEVKSLINSKTKMIVINSPHNPIGKILFKEDLLELQKIAIDHDLIVLSDEVYEHLVYDGEQHESVLRYDELYKRSLIVFSFGKTFHNTGWKVGYCIAPPNLTAEFRKVHQFNVFCVNSFVQYGLADFLEDKEQYLSLGSFYQEKRNILSDALSTSRLKAIDCEGTYFQLYDYSAISDESDTEFAKRITKELGVASIPLSVFYSEPVENRCIRLCFAKTKDNLEAAAERLAKI